MIEGIGFGSRLLGGGGEGSFSREVHVKGAPRDFT